MSSNRVRRPVAIMVLGAALFIAGSLGTPQAAQGAPAEAIEQAGWWWKVQTGTLTDLPAPPNVMPGQLQVQGAVDGPIAVAAIRATLPPATTAPVLTMTVAQGGDQGGALAVILACKAMPGWSASEAGRWTSRPTSDCAGGSALGVRSADGTTFTFALAPLVAADAVDLVLVPGRLEGAPAGADGSTFTQIFEAPTVGSFETGGEALGEEGLIPDLGAPDTPLPDLGTGDAGFAPPPLDSGSFSSPPLGDSGLSLDPIASELPPAAAIENTGGSREVATAPIGAQLPGPSAAARAAGLVILVLGGAWTTWAWTRQPSQGLLPLAGVDADAVRSGGIGRFTRVRDAAPAGLR